MLEDLSTRSIEVGLRQDKGKEETKLPFVVWGEGVEMTNLRLNKAQYLSGETHKEKGGFPLLKVMM